jgi:cellulose synthase/poly-beta-1,6-N-acetylglucosamine synthase-like glycosyltransferase
VPEQRAVLAAQRRRWQRGMTEILWRHRRMIGNPRYGAVGMLAMPWFVLFEVLAPFIELLGLAYLLLFGALWAVSGLQPGTDHQVDLSLGGLLLLVSWGYSLLLTVVALALEEFSFRRYRRRRDLFVALVAAVLETLVLRHLTAFWRVRGTMQALFSTTPQWGTMTRTGFDVDLADGPTAPRARGER